MQRSAALHDDISADRQPRQRERPELLHCEAAAAPARQRLATRPGDAHALAGRARCIVVYLGISWCTLVYLGVAWCILVYPPGVSAWCILVYPPGVY